jgi:adenosylmethionine-8-amino-7-oxononanoate aminotransferase
MVEWDTDKLVAADKKYVWHPFTPMADWCAPEHEPIVLVEGEGALLRDSKGREYIDGNSSIWTNIHGHNHPHINAAIRRQLDRVAHTSFLGFTNPAAIELAEAIVSLFPAGTLSRVFYSDDGSTGIEVALRIAAQYWRLKGSERHQFIAFEHAYHGDTAGAASLGAAAMFQSDIRRWRFPAIQIGAVADLPAPESAEARKVAGVFIEPLIQGAAGMRIWPTGTLGRLREWCDKAGTLLIADEVLTGFGRTGRMFACEHEAIIPDILILAKGLTGGYLPLAITLLREEILAPFSDTNRERTTLAYGHSYTGNSLACAAALASLEVFSEERVLERLQPKIEQMHAKLDRFRQSPVVADVRQCGFIAAIELNAPDDRTRADRLATNVCIAARQYGLLTRPIRNVIVLMPPLCITESQLDAAIEALHRAIVDVCEREPSSVPAAAR